MLVHVGEEVLPEMIVAACFVAGRVFNCPQDQATIPNLSLSRHRPDWQPINWIEPVFF